MLAALDDAGIFFAGAGTDAASASAARMLVYPLDRIAEAEDGLEQRAHFGKIVITLKA